MKESFIVHILGKKPLQNRHGYFINFPTFLLKSVMRDKFVTSLHWCFFSFFHSLCISTTYWNFHVSFQSDHFFLYHSLVSQVTDLFQLCKTDTFSSSQHFIATHIMFCLHTANATGLKSLVPQQLFIFLDQWELWPFSCSGKEGNGKEWIKQTGNCSTHTYVQKKKKISNNLSLLSKPRFAPACFWLR